MVARTQIRICMVSVYPPRGAVHGDIGGVASYTKNLLSNLPADVSVVLLTNNIKKNGRRYIDGNTRVVRCWNKGILSLMQIVIALFRQGRHTDLIHIQHEFFLFGGITTALLFPLFLIIVKLLGKLIVVTFHGVISLSWINEKFFRDNGLSGSPFLARLGLSILVKFIAKLSQAVIVHEEFFREILACDYKIDVDKIRIVRHGVEQRLLEVDKFEARRILKLDEKKKVLLLFGYLSPYKGIDLLIDSFGLLDETYALIIAGGTHPRLRKTKKYNNYLEELRNKAAKIHSGISFTGFVPDSEVALYFIASDLVVFPYSYPTSVGPLWLAVAFEKPFLLSEPLRGLINRQKCIFNLNPKEIAEKIKQMFSDINDYEVLNYARSLKASRSWARIANETSDVYYQLLQKELNSKKYKIDLISLRD